MPTHYEILGVDEKAPQSVIRSAYIAQMRRLHPDKNPGGGHQDSISAADLTVAYGTLKDQFSRASYDFHLARGRYPSVALIRLDAPRSRFWPPRSTLHLLWLIGFALLVNYTLSQGSDGPADTGSGLHSEQPAADIQQQASLSVAVAPR